MSIITGRKIFDPSFFVTISYKLAKFIFSGFKTNMNIQSSQIFKQIYPTIVNKNKQTLATTKDSINTSGKESTPECIFNRAYCNIHFGNLAPKSEAFHNARDYLSNNLENIKSAITYRPINLYDFDLDELEGIQDGIEIFEGLSIKEIAFLLSTLSEVATNRGCYNNCSHCYADARPPHLKKENQINKMDWEDFTNLTNGIKELNSRLGFNARGISSDRTNYLTPFHDSDCIDIAITDKYGIEHDFIDISQRLYNSLNTPVIFDTAGWSPKNIKLQERAEKYVDYFCSLGDNHDNIYQINISFNPFHALNTKSVFFKKIGNEPSSEKLRDLYTTRMANVLYTFTPLLYKLDGKMSILPRAIKDEQEGFEGFKVSDLNEIFAETIKKLKKVYEADFENRQMYISNKKQIKTYLHKYKTLYKNSLSTRINMTEKINRTLKQKPDNEFLERVQIIENNMPQTTLFDYLNSDIIGIIDANGKYYLTNYVLTIPTELALNFKNKNKITADIKPNLTDDYTITKDFVNGELL